MSTSPEITGHFFDPDPPPPHRCSLPSLRSPELADHSGWRCVCGQAYVVEYSEERSPGIASRVWRWERSPSYDSISEVTRQARWNLRSGGPK